MSSILRKLLFSRISCLNFILNIASVHTCDKFKKGIREVFFPFQGGFQKCIEYIGKLLNNSFQGDLLILFKVACFRRNLRAHFRESP